MITPVHESALAAYVCPACKGKLESHENALCCDACHVTYPLVNGIPDFLLEDREQLLRPFRRYLTRVLVRLYETPLWYPRILKQAGGRNTLTLSELIRQMDVLMDIRQGVLLDVACGPGTWGRRLASPAMEVYGIDMSWSMLRDGMRKVAKEHITHMNFAHARVEALPFGGHQFDAAYCGGALHGFQDTVGSLQEIGRTLKSGAPLVVMTFLNRDQPFLRMRQRAEARNPKLLKLHFFEVDELKCALEQAGFEEYQPQVYGGIILFKARKTK
jgi:SAM-dependent methyltransferase